MAGNMDPATPRRRQRITVSNDPPVKKRRRGGTSRADAISIDGTSSESDTHSDRLNNGETLDGSFSDPPSTLFYKDGGRGRRTPAFRVLPIMPSPTPDVSDEITVELKLSPGWPAKKASRVVNIFLEGDGFTAEASSSRHCHIHFPGHAVPNRDAIYLSDIRRKLATALGIDDALRLQIEVQRRAANSESPSTFNGSICTRSNGAWNDATITDRLSLNQALAHQKDWLRVWFSDYIHLSFAGKDFSSAVTPSHDSTHLQLRDFIASFTDIPAGAARLHHDGVQLEEAFERLSYANLMPWDVVVVNTETRECVNCLDDVGWADYATQSTTELCAHSQDICNTCIAAWITASLDNGNWSKISCLTADCGEVLQYRDVKHSASKADMSRYEKFATRDALSQMPDFKWCINPGCEHGQIHDDGGGREQILTCGSCNFKRCTACDRQWHQDETCEQYVGHFRSTDSMIRALKAFIHNDLRSHLLFTLHH